ncbi:hypothetical protein DACRYDRAFT_108060 [Dacryopinax primogenitus]|uniref:F-box domain-containing protein n=1 Tax=Dacryopinax primogenitus (strain DJM 731) TaxID=1858805 RepID=M5FUR9_DACPD|nr:uncharacterized protein DACRYDRAFT_108060 [Dacryopinax primogenitus]EJU01511.1 hypothetical protein DACRYDRAFT_108060 [Dacryopinax primogenitus]
MHQLKLGVDDGYTMHFLPASKPLRSTYCALCGVDLRGRFHEDRYGGGNEQRYRNVRPVDTKWLSDVRALRGWQPADRENWRVERSDVGSYDAIQYFGSDVIIIGPRVVPVNTTSTVPVHNACSEILLAHTTEEDIGNVWQSIQARRGLDRRRVNDCGLATSRQGVWWEEIEGEEYMVTDPLKPLSFPIDLASAPDNERLSTHVVQESYDFFSRLPSELVFYILSFLIPYPSTLLSLRHAAPRVFRASPWAGNHFWSQVTIAEMGGFLLEVREMLAKLDNLEEGSGFAIWRKLTEDRSVKNRRRIARLVISAAAYK